MNRDKDELRFDALHFLKLSSIAYLEAQNDGEANAVAACSEILKDYTSIVTSEEYREPSVGSTFTPQSGLDDIDIDEFLKDLPCAKNFKDCGANKITDADVQEFMNLSKPPKSLSGNGSFGINLPQGPSEKNSNGRETSNVEPTFSTHLRENKSENMEVDSSEPNPAKHKLADRKIEGPPIKIPARTSSNNPSPASQGRPITMLQGFADRFAVGSAKPATNATQCQSEPTSFHQLRTISSSQAPPPGPSQPRFETRTPQFPAAAKDFTSASEELRAQNLKKYGTSNPVPRVGLSKSSANSFKVPSRSDEAAAPQVPEENVDPLLRGIDEKLLEIIRNEVVVNAKEVTWDDIAGLEAAKDIIQEAVILPLLRPDLFQGLRSIPKGILLFGPPGTGKTLIGKCIASQSDATFLSISASTLTSKWVGEGEKLVRALFTYARVHQPSVIFLDEIDSILKKRSDTEHESSRRLKTEFLIQFDGANAIQENDRVLLVGATNLPQELDDAARRRFTKRLYIPLPEQKGRRELLVRLLQKNANNLTERDFIEVSAATDGFSGADIKNLCADASMICLRELPKSQIKNVDANSLRPINVEDFRTSLKRVKATVSRSELQQYVEWNQNFGSTS